VNLPGGSGLLRCEPRLPAIAFPIGGIYLGDVLGQERLDQLRGKQTMLEAAENLVR
jgi:hypothetical protein